MNQDTAGSNADPEFFQKLKDSVFPIMEDDIDSFRVLQPEDEVNLGGIWQVTYFDANGSAYDIDLDISQTNLDFVGTAHVSSKVGPRRVSVGDFTVFGAVENDKIWFQIDNKLALPVSLKFEGQIARTRGRIHQCFYGCVNQTASDRFLGGVWIGFRLLRKAPR